MKKRLMKKGDIFMKPRVFVSSTFYDLKYVREDISNFIKSHDFEPIMFEDGDIGYTPGKPLDKSCYDTMKNSDMVILIIGGNYGSPSTEQNETINTEFDDYISITRQEFKTAVEEGIPIFVFIESSVYVEYNVFELNKKEIETISSLKFSATKNINVFSFINEIRSIGNIAITDFKKPSQIKEFLGKQWSDMFKSYLKKLREDEDFKKTHDSIDELRSAIGEVQILVNSLFEKAFNTQVEIEYDSIKNQQRNIRAQSIAKSILNNVHFDVKFDTNTDLHFIMEKFIDLIIEISKKIKKQDELLYDESVNEDISLEDYYNEFFKKSYDIGIDVYRCKNRLFYKEYITEMSNDYQLKIDVEDALVTNIND
jgi:hypothetical protein